MKDNELLEKEIERELSILKHYTPNEDGYKEAVESLAKLYKVKLAADRNSAQLKEQKKERIVNAALTTAGIVLPLIFYASWMAKGFRFEETGTFTSSTFRSLFGKFRPTK